MTEADGFCDTPTVTDDGSDNIFPQAAGGEVTAYESGGLPAWPLHCESYPVWCCTRSGRRPSGATVTPPA